MTSWAQAWYIYISSTNPRSQWPVTNFMINNCMYEKTQPNIPSILLGGGANSHGEAPSSSNRMSQQLWMSMGWSCLQIMQKKDVGALQTALYQLREVCRECPSTQSLWVVCAQHMFCGNVFGHENCSLVVAAKVEDEPEGCHKLTHP